MRRALILVVVLAVLAPVAVFAAGGTFVDDDTSIFEANIEWMSANGITSGCGPDTYCPEDNVTRGQMAAFMQRLATLKVVDAATAVEADHAAEADNAGTVDGYDANALNRVAYDIDESGDPVTVTGLIDVDTVLSVEITAPRGGYITVDGQIGLTRQGDGLGATFCDISVDDIDGTPGADILDGSRASLSDTSVAVTETCSSHAAFASFFGGTYTVNFEVAVFVDAVDADQGTLIVQYTPFNGAGVAPLIFVLPPIITLGEIADQVAVVDPDVAARLSDIKSALGN
jgi:hypothetical protein